jgi:hypothetical protein
MEAIQNGGRKTLSSKLEFKGNPILPGCVRRERKEAAAPGWERRRERSTSLA